MLTEHVPSVATEQTRSQLHDADSQVQEAFLQACQFSTVTRKFLPNRSAFLAVWPWPTHVTSLDLNFLTCKMSIRLKRLDDVNRALSVQQ